MANINKITNKLNKEAKQVIESVAIEKISYCEEKVLKHYIEMLQPLQQVVDLLYAQLEKDTFTKLNRESFNEMIRKNFDVKLASVLVDYKTNCKEFVLKIGREVNNDKELYNFLDRYTTELIHHGASKRRVEMEIMKIQHTFNRRLLTLLNEGFSDNLDKEIVNYAEYLMDSIEYFAENYTIDETTAFIEEEVFEVNEWEKRKITDRTELEEMAIANGFKLKRINGSHHIYENAEGKVTVIPFHSTDIGIGLSCAIQKQILLG